MKLWSLDHKEIGKSFLWAGLLFLALGGTEAMLIRFQWGWPGARVPLLGGLLYPHSGGAITAAGYQSLFTLHGVTMIFFAITPILIGAFGNFLIPLLIGAEDMAFPRLNLASLWLLLASQVVLVSSMFGDLGAPTAGWTMYPPLSTRIGSPGTGQTLMVVALFLNGLSSILGAVNYVTTVIQSRAPGMSWLRLPLTIWGLFLTAILNVLFAPVLGAAALLLFVDRVFGTQFFVAGAAVKLGGDPVLYQHLFWIFGHPEVYILILPAWGMVGDLVAYFSRKPAFGYRLTVGAMCMVTVLSGAVYAHHMFLTGLQPMLGKGFMTLTLLISLPAEVMFLNWLRTMWNGALRLHTPMLFAMGTMFVFGIGGVTGLYLAAIATDIPLHDTMFVVGHFHLTMAAATFLGSFAGLYFWFPKMFGRLLDERLGKVHFYGSVVLLTLVFGGQMVAGYGGQQRRLYDPYQYEFLRHLLSLNRWTTVFAFALAVVQGVFVVNFLYSLLRGEKAPQNPWDVGTLEWTLCPSPPPAHNFEGEIVVHHGPHELSRPDVLSSLGRDWVGQAEPLPVGVVADAAGRAT